MFNPKQAFRVGSAHDRSSWDQQKMWHRRPHLHATETEWVVLNWAHLPLQGSYKRRLEGKWTEHGLKNFFPLCSTINTVARRKLEGLQVSSRFSIQSVVLFEIIHQLAFMLPLKSEIMLSDHTETYINGPCTPRAVPVVKCSCKKKKTS